MSLIVAYVKPDGTVATITPIVNPGEDELTIAQGIQEQNPGSEIISVKLAKALRRGDAPTDEISIKEFKKRLAPMILTLAGKPVSLQNKWDRIINLINTLPSINVTDQVIKNIANQAVADGLMTQADADDLLRIT